MKSGRSVSSFVFTAAITWNGAEVNSCANFSMLRGRSTSRAYNNQERWNAIQTIVIIPLELVAVLRNQ